MERYNFKAAYVGDDKRRKDSWRRVVIDGSSRLWELDQAMRKAFGYDVDDHLSSYSTGGCLFLVSPRLSEDEGNHPIQELRLEAGAKIWWAWDLGISLKHVVVLEGMEEK